ncbi:hypothetical protein FK220_005745 [Flavobacteriaceae bacterium TP-CH-4]|uniref:Uncharacterized protein n=1 Tax=Pelagihabitans pacificus TaxID=2696054 RepID=A0A967E4X2_9FLAO|nr:hypothetical protein [Pelagihabitans pacificus]NHF58832.1 hypothetical protein [Pelagihabitans pacificus]
MKDAVILLKDQPTCKGASQKRRQQLLLKKWLGWAGGYSSLKQEKHTNITTPKD